MRRLVLLLAVCERAEAQSNADAMFDDPTPTVGTMGGYAQPMLDADMVSSPNAPVAHAGTGCTLASGTFKYDLSEMHRTDHDYTGSTVGGYAYRFNVCGNTVRACGMQPSPASKWRGTKCNNLGDPQTQTIQLMEPKNPYGGIKLTYKDGDICKRQVRRPRVQSLTQRALPLPSRRTAAHGHRSRPPLPLPPTR